MTVAPPIFKEVNNPDAPQHLGRVFGDLSPLCKKLPASEMDLIAWVSSRGWRPGENYCSECAELYNKGLAWKFSET
jgi:hypothetical protein